MAFGSRETWLRTALVIGGVVLPFLAVEGVASLLSGLESGRNKPRMPASVAAEINEDDHHIPTIEDPYIGYRMQPGIERERVQTNAFGLRAGPIETEPPDGVFRILFLGGSVAWGYESNSNDDTIAAYLETWLAEDPRSQSWLGGRRPQVLNAGVPGYVSWQEALLYGLHLRRLRPHVVVTLDGTNDVASAVRVGRAGAPMRWGLVRGAFRNQAPTLLGSLWSWLGYRIGELEVTDLMRTLRPKSVQALGAPEPGTIGVELAAAVSQLGDVATASGARVVTVLQPMAILPGTKPLTEFETSIVRHHELRMPGRNAYYEAAYHAIWSELEKIAETRAGLRVFDGRLAYAQEPGAVYTDHCHLTPLGRLRLAEAIGTFLVAPQ